MWCADCRKSGGRQDEKDKTPSYGQMSRSLSRQDARIGFHICNVGYVFGMPVLLFGEAPPNDRIIFVLNSTSTNPTLLYIKPVNAAASRSSSLRLNLIITLAESVSFRRGELAVKARVVEQPGPHLRIF